MLVTDTLVLDVSVATSLGEADFENDSIEVRVEEFDPEGLLLRDCVDSAVEVADVERVRVREKE